MSVFARHQFLIGLSIDGVQETHDAYRHRKLAYDGLLKEKNAPNLKMNRPGTYEHALHAADLLKRYGVDFNILTVVNRQTAARIEDIYEDYRRRGWNYQQYIICLRRWDRLCPIPRMCFQQKSMAIS